MRRLAMFVHEIGEFLFGLSDKTRLRLVVMGLLLLGGSGLYKFVVNVRDLQKPSTMTATPDQMIRPMEQLIRQTSTAARRYQQGRQLNQRGLDSLTQLHYNQSKPTR